jgi:AcrR family transcriptional regulator
MAKDRRKKILKAAEAMLRDRRFHEVTMDAVAQAAGVGKGTIYRYFENKDALFEELANFGFDELYETIRATPADSADFSRNLLGVCTSISEFFDKRHTLMRIMNEAEERELGNKKRIRCSGHRHRHQLHAELMRWLEEGVKTGELSENVPLDQLALFLLNMLRGRRRYLQHHDTEIPMENLISVFLDGCRSRRSE